MSLTRPQKSYCCVFGPDNFCVAVSRYCCVLRPVSKRLTQNSITQHLDCCCGDIYEVQKVILRFSVSINNWGRVQIAIFEPTCTDRRPDALQGSTPHCE